MSKTSDVEYEIVPHKSRNYWFNVRPVDSRQEASPKYAFGYSLFEIERTCSAREVGACWINDGVPPAVMKLCGEFMAKRLRDLQNNVGTFIAFHHNPGALRLLKAAGFEQFCKYPGNDEEIVHGMSLTIRDSDWERDFDQDDEDDWY